jgi:hypothetical protein
VIGGQHAERAVALPWNAPGTGLQRYAREEIEDLGILDVDRVEDQSRLRVGRPRGWRLVDDERR